MAQRNILLLEKEGSPWISFFEEFFEDTSARLHPVTDPQAAGGLIDRISQDVAFVNADTLTKPLIQKLKVLRQHSVRFRAFQLGFSKEGPHLFPFDDVFQEITSFSNFQKQLVQHLPLPEKIRVLLVDDEHEIGAMMLDFFERRVNPSFELEYVDNGVKGLQALERSKPDIVILDIKMPIKDGREVYREIRKRGWDVPVVIFFDAISGDEMMEIHKFGRPAVVEKGSHQSAMPEMMTLIKKMVYFG